MIYLASPYTSELKTVEAFRYMYATEALANLLDFGLNAYSPIVHWHQANITHKLGGTYEAYQKHDEEMIIICDRFVILTLDGWIDSNGIAKEIRWAKLQDKLIELMDFKELKKGNYLTNLCTL